MKIKKYCHRRCRHMDGVSVSPHILKWTCNFHALYISHVLDLNIVVGLTDRLMAAWLIWFWFSLQNFWRWWRTSSKDTSSTFLGDPSSERKWSTCAMGICSGQTLNSRSPSTNTSGIYFLRRQTGYKSSTPISTTTHTLSLLTWNPGTCWGFLKISI